MMAKEKEYKNYSFSTTDKKVQKVLDQWKKDKMLSAQVIKSIRRANKIDY